VKLDMTLTEGQAASWYHGKILRILHGKQNHTKRYLTDEQVIEVFTGEVEIQEKIDGRLNCSLYRSEHDSQEFWLSEGIDSKDTPHDHIIKYSAAWRTLHQPKTPLSKHVWIDRVYIGYDGKPEFIPMLFGSSLKYGTIRMSNPTIDQIYLLLEAFSKLASHYGSPVIEGVVCKNYEKQLMAKWINDEFEDGLHEK